MGQVENCAACQYRTRPVFALYTYGDNGTKEAGQVTLDNAAVPSGVNATVQSIATDYDNMGRVWTVTSYPGTGGTGTAVNQVEDSYNGWGILADEWQNPDGQVNPSSSPAVQYTYADGASGDVAAYLRLEQVTYPSGQEIDYNYGVGSTLPQAAVDAIMSRLSSISDGNSGATDAVYTYLGLDTIVTEDYNDPSNPAPRPASRSITCRRTTPASTASAACKRSCGGKTTAPARPWTKRPTRV